MRDWSRSGGDRALLPEDEFGFLSAAVHAFNLVDRKIAASWMLRDNGELCRLAALRAGIIHKYVKGHTMRPFVGI